MTHGERERTNRAARSSINERARGYPPYTCPDACGMFRSRFDYRGISRVIAPKYRVRVRSEEDHCLVKTNEKDLPTSQPTAETNARISGTNGNSGGAQRTETAPQQGTSSPRNNDTGQTARLRRKRRPQSLSAADRLHHSAEFRFLQRNGLRAESANFVLYAGHFAGDERWRLGITVSKRVGNAVIRNRIKRQVRELFRREIRTTMPAGTAMVVIARPGAAELAGEALSGELRVASEKLAARLKSNSNSKIK